MEKMLVLFDYLKFIKAPVSHVLETRSNYDEIIDHVLSTFIDDKIILTPFEKDGELKSGDEIYRVNTDSRVRINFYRNSILHFFIPISFIAIAMRSNRKGEGSIKFNSIISDLKYLIDLFSSEFIYSEMLDDIKGASSLLIEYMESKSIITRKGREIIIDESKRDLMQLFAEIVQDYFESYQVVVNTVLELNEGEIDKKDLMVRIRKTGVDMYNSGGIKLAESLSLPNYNNAIQFLTGKGVLAARESEGGKKFLTINDIGTAREIQKRIASYMSDVI
jgi:glycerol-3-phosphate O-acyltransferase